MFLNLTFFVQLVNFFITYWVCNRFFFKPLLVRVLEKRELQKKLRLECIEAKLKTTELEAQKNALLCAFQQTTQEKQTRINQAHDTNHDFSLETIQEPLVVNKAELIARAKTFIKDRTLHDL